MKAGICGEQAWEILPECRGKEKKNHVGEYDGYREQKTETWHKQLTLKKRTEQMDRILQYEIKEYLLTARKSFLSWLKWFAPSIPNQWKETHI